MQHEHDLLNDAQEPTERKAAKRSVHVSIIVNILLSAIQIVTGFFAHSSALIADGIHSFSDLLADFVVLLAGKHSRKAPDENHQYGHYRYENAASLVLGILLLVVGLGILYSAISKFTEPSHIPKVHIIALWIAFITLCAKEGLFRYMLHIAKKVHSSMLVANAWHARSDAASSLVVGLGIIGNLMGYPLLDPVAALIVSGFILRIGTKFTWRALQDLIDIAATPEEIDAIHQTLLSVPGILGLHRLRTRKAGDMLQVDVHLEVDPNLSVAKAHAIAKEARKQVLAKHRVLDILIKIDPHFARTAPPVDSGTT